MSNAGAHGGGIELLPGENGRGADRAIDQQLAIAPDRVVAALASVDERGLDRLQIVIGINATQALEPRRNRLRGARLGGGVQHCNHGGLYERSTGPPDDTNFRRQPKTSVVLSPKRVPA
jgi:hypothetical protein